MVAIVRDLATRMQQRNAALNGGLTDFLEEQVAEIDRLEAELGGLVKLQPDLNDR